jgi:hypothetical protein
MDPAVDAWEIARLGYFEIATVESGASYFGDKIGNGVLNFFEYGTNDYHILPNNKRKGQISFNYQPISIDHLRKLKRLVILCSLLHVQTTDLFDDGKMSYPTSVNKKVSRGRQ